MRKYYIDKVRCATVLLVVLYHVIYMYNGVATDGVIGPFCTPQYQDCLQYLLYPWFMVILFVVSGMCSRFYLDRHTVKEFVSSRTRKLLVPSTIGLFVFQWILGYFNMAISDAFSKMPEQMPVFILYPIMVVSGTGVLWYIQLLWLFSMVLALIRKVEKGKLYGFCEKANVRFLILLVIPVYGAAQILNTPVIAVYRFGIYGLCFLLGYFVFANDAVMERLSRCWLVLTAAALVLGAAYTWHYFGQNYAVEPVVNSPFSVLYGWAAVLAVLAFAKRWGDFSSPLSDWLSERNFGLYVFHYVPLAACAYLLHRHTALTAFPSYLLTGLAAFGGGYLLNAVISGIPVLRWCVLGIKRKKKE